MGTDIHAFVEVKRGTTWQYAGSYADRSGRIEQLPIERNYSLFSMLSGMRSRNDEPWPGTIASITGIPADSCAEIHQLVASISLPADEVVADSGAATLADILAYPWYTPIAMDERVHPDEIAYFETTGMVAPCPDFLAEQWSFERLDAYFDAMQPYTYILPLRHFANQFCSEIVPQLLALGQPECVRIVFLYS